MSAWFLFTTVDRPGQRPTPRPLSQDAAAAPRDLVATSLTEVDEDFALQGEYLGEVRAVDGRRVAFGLQVVALGDGRFSALGYQGGLPGNGWDRENLIAWDGARQADVLTLAGPARHGDHQAGSGRVIDAAGVEVGHVRKVRRTSTTLGAAPPPRAIVLFDGTGVTGSNRASITAEGWLAPGAVTKLPVRDFQLHLEFQTPYMPVRPRAGPRQQRRLHSAAVRSADPRLVRPAASSSTAAAHCIASRART